ncbi:ABC transporter substrate-binding protein [Micromonospora sp. WMMD998]|uniref:ABC transporter substrate-binding protein n=1 Tax=Micromonospora sp. WMMD998 TaxID=3016092 RepID=UPI00249A4FD7|nr:ABC transporter substrate-binding protein [Micromonospora sp. WMMD998]WFE38370.1 ABC transporter substrate-binding protein [Micromonospora sp. WMMD998]
MATPAFDCTVLTRRGILTAAAGSLLLAGCGPQGQRPGEGATSSSPGDQDMVVGASLELSGRGAALGLVQRRALEIMAESLNRSGIPVGNLHRSIRLEIRDNGSDPRLAARHAADLTQAGSHALVGGVLGETAVALASAAEQLKTPFLALGHADRIVLPLADRTFSFKLTPDSADVARRMVDLLESQRIRRVALLAADGPHGDSGVRAVREALGASTVDLVRTLRLPDTGRSFRAAAERVTAGDPDGVVVWGAAPDSGEAARALRRAGHHGPLFFDPGAVVDDTLSRANAKAVEGAYAVHPACLGGSALTATSGAQVARRDFDYRYTQRHGTSVGFAPYAADALHLLAAAAREATSLDRGRLRAFLQTQMVEGIAGGYAFTPDHHGGMEADSLGVYRVSQSSWTRYA